MFRSTRDFIKRHRTNLALGFGIVGAGYVAIQYIGSKLTEARTRMMSDRVARENIHRRFQQNQEDCTFTVLALLPTATNNIVKELPVEKLTAELQKKKAARIAKSTATTDAGSDTSAIPGTPALTTTLAEDDGQSLKSFASESFITVKESDAASIAATEQSTENIRSAETKERIPRKSKIQLWEEIKITSITRSFTILYTLTLLTLLTRVQLNLLGRKNYLSSVLSLAERDNDPTIRLESHDDVAGSGSGADMETNRQYLTFSWWLLHRGWRILMGRVESATRDVFGPLTPRDTISLSRFRELATEVRRIVEFPSAEQQTSATPGSHWLPYLLPPAEEEFQVLSQSGTVDPDSLPEKLSPELRRLLDETSDLIESPMAANVLANMLNIGFDVLMEDKLATGAFRTQSRLGMTSDDVLDGRPRIEEIENSEDSTTKFASVLAVLARQAHVIGSGGENEYLKAMETGTELEGFSALVYSSNFEFAAQLGTGDELPRK